MALLSLRVLVVGMLRERTGKTALIMSLATGLKKRGVKVGIMKPLGFCDWYSDYMVVREGLEEGRLAAREAIEAKLVLGLREPCEVLNPVSCLLVPLNPITFYEYRAPRSFFTYHLDLMRRIAAVRLTFYTESGAISRGYLNAPLLERGLALVSVEEVKRMLRRAEFLEKVKGIRELNKVLSGLAPKAILSCLDYLSRRYRVLLIEGLGDLAWPLGDLREDVDCVIAVAPGMTVVYDAARYKLAVGLRAEISGDVRVEEVAEYLTPKAYFKIPPLDYGELPESRAEKIEPLIEYLVDAWQR